MLGKLCIFAFLCFALPQVRGNNLEEAKRQALLKLKGTAMGAEKAVEISSNEVNIKRELVRNKTIGLLTSEHEMEKQIRINLNRTSEEMKKKAKEMNKPPATYDCIKKAHDNAVAQLQPLGQKFDAEIKNLEKVKLASIADAAKPLEEIKKTLSAKYEKAVAEVKAAKDEETLRKTMERLGKEYALISVEAKKVLTPVGQIVGQFMSEASASYSKVAETGSRIEAEGHQTMKNCVW